MPRVCSHMFRPSDHIICQLPGTQSAICFRFWIRRDHSAESLGHPDIDIDNFNDIWPSSVVNHRGMYCTNCSISIGQPLWPTFSTSMGPFSITVLHPFCTIAFFHADWRIQIDLLIGKFRSASAGAVYFDFLYGSVTLAYTVEVEQK